MTIPPDLLEAYRRTRYRVEAEPPFHLRVDEPSPPLADLLARCGARSAAFITAWNPYSKTVSAAENAAAQARLRVDLDARGCTVVPGFGEWEGRPERGEESFLALGLDRAAACALGRAYRQHALLFAGGDAIPRLVDLSADT